MLCLEKHNNKTPMEMFKNNDLPYSMNFSAYAYFNSSIFQRVRNFATMSEILLGEKNTLSGGHITYSMRDTRAIRNFILKEEKKPGIYAVIF